MFREYAVVCFALSMLVLAGCGGSREVTAKAEPLFYPISYDEALDRLEEAAIPVGTLALEHCPPEDFESAVAGPWNSKEGQDLAAELEPSHVANDVIATVGSPIRIEARIAYGDSRASLEHEWVRVYLGTCDGWRQVGHQKTFPGGVVRLSLQERLPVGVYKAAVQVVGDRSYVPLNVWIVPRDTNVVLFTLDGTLMPRDAPGMPDDPAGDWPTPFESTPDASAPEALAAQSDDASADRHDEGPGGGHVDGHGGGPADDAGSEAPSAAKAAEPAAAPPVYPGSVELTRAYASKGYLIVYLADEDRRAWLTQAGLAPGALLSAELSDAVLDSATNSEPADSEQADAAAASRDSGRDAFERAFNAGRGGERTLSRRGLDAIEEAGLAPAAAYASRASEIETLVRAGIALEAIWVNGTAGDGWMLNKVRGNWEAHARELAPELFEAPEPVEAPERGDDNANADTTGADSEIEENPVDQGPANEAGGQENPAASGPDGQNDETGAVAPVKSSP